MSIRDPERAILVLLQEKPQTSAYLRDHIDDRVPGLLVSMEHAGRVRRDADHWSLPCAR